MCKSCSECGKFANNHAPDKSHIWEPCSEPWQRIHIDFAGPFKGNMWFLVTNAYSKWPEVILMCNGCTSGKTIEVLRHLFARHGLPTVLVSDNCRSLVSHEFENFLEANKIIHITSQPYHPSTNGQVERLVQTFKQSLSKLGSTIETSLSRFLLTYRNAIHPSTNASSAKLFVGRNLRMRLNLLRKPTVKKGRSCDKETF